VGSATSSPRADAENAEKAYRAEARTSSERMTVPRCCVERKGEGKRASGGSREGGVNRSRAERNRRFLSQLKVRCFQFFHPYLKDDGRKGRVGFGAQGEHPAVEQGGGGGEQSLKVGEEGRVVEGPGVGRIDVPVDREKNFVKCVSCKFSFKRGGKRIEWEWKECQEAEE
jgi:hypothetical protein